jgi:hypothetical protein
LNGGHGGHHARSLEAWRGGAPPSESPESAVVSSASRHPLRGSTGATSPPESTSSFPVGTATVRESGLPLLLCAEAGAQLGGACCRSPTAMSTGTSKSTSMLSCSPHRLRRVDQSLGAWAVLTRDSRHVEAPEFSSSATARQGRPQASRSTTGCDGPARTLHHLSGQDKLPPEQEPCPSGLAARRRRQRYP